MIYKKAVSHFKKNETSFFELDRCFCLLYPLISDHNNNLKCCILRTFRGSCCTVVQNEVQVIQNISLAVHTPFETSVRYVSETVDEKIWHWDLLESWKNMAFLVFFGLFWCFWVSFSLSRAVSASFWHCI